MEYKLIIPYNLPCLNDYIRAERTHWSKAANMKSETEKGIILLCRQQLRSVKIEKPVYMQYLWVERNRRRDRDNIAFAKKFIQDALIKADILKNDNWAAIIGFSDEFAIDKQNSRVEIIIKEG